MQFYLDGVRGRPPYIAELMHQGEADGIASRTPAESSVLFFSFWR